MFAICRASSLLRRANDFGWYILTPFVAFSSLAVYVASAGLPRGGMLFSELPAGKAEVPV
jgi:hypothetical protein